MDDRTLLELAAKAAGQERSAAGDLWSNARSCLWNPLEDDGDALRLAVKLNLQVTPGTYCDHEATAFHAGKGEAHEHVHYQQDLYAATRRAIVRAAAAMGSNIKPEIDDAIQ